MPFLRKAELQPVKGINLAIPSTYLPDGNNYPQNMQYLRGEMKKRDGKSVIGGVSLGAQKILHLGTFETTSGNNRLIRHTKTNIQKYNTAQKRWDDITGADLTGSETDFTSSGVVTESDLYLSTNYINNIRKYADTGVTANLGGSPPKAKFIEYVTPYVLLAYVDTFPSKVAWCDTGQPEVWAGGNAGSVLLSDDSTYIRGMKKLRDYVFVYKEGSIYKGNKVATSDVFDFGGPFSTGKGLYSGRAIASDGENHYYMGLNDFHINNGVRIIDIGGPIREYLFNRLNRERNNTCHAIHMEYYKEVWFFVTVAGSDWPEEVWKYNYETGFWYFDTVANCTASINYKQSTSLTWDDLIGTWDQQIIHWDDQQGSTDAPIQVFGFDTGFTARLDSSLVNDMGQAVDARLDTKDFTGLTHNGIEFDSRFLQFDVWASGDTVKLSYSLDYGANWIFVGEKALGSSIERVIFYFDVIAKRIRFRLQAESLASRLIIRGFTPYYLAGTEHP